MMRAHPFPWREKRQNAKHSQQHDHRIEARPLPVTAAEMQPHPELIKRECHAEPVSQRTGALLRVVQSSKEQHAAYRGQRKDSVVEMMHMSPAHVQKQIGHSA